MIGYSSVLARWSMNIISLGFCQIHGISLWINRSFSGILCLIGPIGPAAHQLRRVYGHISGHSVHYLGGQKIGVRSSNWQVHCLFLPVTSNNFQLKHPCGDWISEVSGGETALSCNVFLKPTFPRFFAGGHHIILCWFLLHRFWCWDLLFETQFWVSHFRPTIICSKSVSVCSMVNILCRFLQVHPRKANMDTQKKPTGMSMVFRTWII